MKPLLIAAMLLLPGCAWLGQQAPDSPAERRVAFDAAIHDELISMRDADQEARAGVDGDRVMEVDRKNTARMKAIIAARGWPGRSLVGDDGAQAAWLLVQHADQDRPFQAACLPLLEAAARAGEASWSEVAYFTDRVRVGEHKPQVYGTQFGMVDGKLQAEPIEDPVGLDARRAKVGLEPFAQYQARLLARIAARAPKDPALREKLLAADKARQEAMRADYRAYLASPARRERMAWVKALVERRGWPGRTQVGDDGDQALHTLIQEDDRDLPFLRKCLTLLEAACRTGETSAARVAGLTDQILVEEGQRQRYGTIFTRGAQGLEPLPIEDEAHVDERRQALGLGTLAEELAAMRRLDSAR